MCVCVLEREREGEGGSHLGRRAFCLSKRGVVRLPFYDRESFTEVPNEITRKLLIKVNHNGRIPVYLHYHAVNSVHAWHPRVIHSLRKKTDE